MKITMLGHSTFMVELDGKKILTDPWLTDPIYMGLLRHGVPVPAPTEIAVPDFIIISHGHVDHCDPATLRAFPRSLPVIIFEKYAKVVRKAGFRNVIPVKAGDKVSMAGVDVTALPGRHPGGVTTFMLRTTERLFFGADTVHDEGLREAVKGSRPDAAIMPISGGRLGPFPFHMGPPDAARLTADMEARTVVPSHYHFTYGNRVLDRTLMRPACLREFHDAMATIAPGIRIMELKIMETGSC